ncbi:hypothetical protein HYH84_12545 [Clostridium botulinum]|uniref:hypothetical protein n=1 Tax=Clostridium botulinum TaxID=1491 RepID=UPI0013F9C761|nr:hypothetical protein [Clostridium botulinum]MBY6761764.1 hypothetical protein [Clostridium botulinum]NFG27228.1 hypothetical protein [Clostridium botulinum]
MKTVIEYTKTNSEIRFEHIEDKCCFYNGGVLYMKILQQDLKYLGINNANAISILNAGLTFFESDEIVNEATKEQISK